MLFKDITGQSEVGKKLVEGVSCGRVVHSQLFTGSTGSGDLALAAAYAGYLNCTDRGDDDSCGRCPSCLKAAQLVHPDIHFVFPVNTPKGKSSSDKPLSRHFMTQWRELFIRHKGYIGEQLWYQALDIDNKQGNISAFEADEIIRSLSLKSFEGEYKVVIIWLPERMNVQAANKLLKILEEPWSKSVFLLVSESPESLLPTILSRTQVVSVPAIADSDMREYLIREKGVAPETAAAVARISHGSITEAERLLSEESENGEHLDLFIQLMRFSYEDRHLELLEWGDAVASMGREAQKRLMVNSIRLLRDSYMITAGLPEISFLYGKEYDFCRKFAPFVNNTNIEQLIAEMETVIKQVGWNGNPRLIFPHFALTVSKLVNKI